MQQSPQLASVGSVACTPTKTILQALEFIKCLNMRLAWVMLAGWLIGDSTPRTGLARPNSWVFFITLCAASMLSFEHERHHAAEATHVLFGDVVVGGGCVKIHLHGGQLCQNEPCMHTRVARPP